MHGMIWSALGRDGLDRYGQARGKNMYGVGWSGLPFYGVDRIAMMRHLYAVPPCAI